MDNKTLYNARVASSWRRHELGFLIVYALLFYFFIIRRSLHLSQEHYVKLYGLRSGWIFPPRLNDLSDAQWRNFRGNLPILTTVFLIYALVANFLRSRFLLRAKGMSIIWLIISFTYLLYLHEACVIFIISIASLNFLIVKIFARTKFFLYLLWTFNLYFLLSNRVYEGYSFSTIGLRWSYLDNFRGTFRWQICFNFVVLRMISFGYDYHWAYDHSHFDQKKHNQRCEVCKSGGTCYQLLQEKGVQDDKFTFTIYLCYLVYAPLYLAGPIVSFNAFASQLDVPQNNYKLRHLAWYGLRWTFSFLLMELMTHLFHYNALAISGLWKQLSPLDVFIIGYGVLNFMWLKFFLIWRYFRFWSLVCGIDVPENMPRCINNCYNLEGFWKSWHASYNKWLVRYMYIPLGGSKRKAFNVWIVFTFVAIWHDLEWKLLWWAWLTCLFFVPEMVMKSAVSTFKAESAITEFVVRELSAIAGAITITCLMVANLVGYVIGPSGINSLGSRFLNKQGFPVLGGMFVTFYVGTKLMFHIRDAERKW
ncbi:membrane-bound O-acyltransferase gup1 isoform X1 [Cucumis melo]|uniref:Membrane-bound O-acyltransferase C24H6.01c isoform X1 n=2 Tax=Cucumis melo TaxID=3656 RepID=A0A1S3C2C9_CUCME|nr:membrane-bound O-acyltransferase gup1 isoform X1 [Cucumis melo]XP_008456247.1 membrane-bound O-acyltransferase gup1 isoform X1 [Cucumis melo]XP_008456248.1 membrane-bound O-acyltransferase gup1 isoform X1 [Cucumis melo]XP_050947558.1 membrane-bound O-acyltransferase gup1 isoform X1 [Cucumis melo]